MAKERPEEKFTTLVHHINVENLALAHMRQNPRKAPGVDRVTKDEYDKQLYPNLARPRGPHAAASLQATASEKNLH
ncbi:MAG: hypothetical protein DDT20_01169 [Firmicutes bacterium]|nr:hypothetical protein [Bacillota bacterium]